MSTRSHPVEDLLCTWIPRALALVLAFSRYETARADAAADAEKCSDRQAKFQSDLRTDASGTGILYSTPRSFDDTPKLYMHTCVPYEVTCSGLEYHVDLSTQKLSVVSGGVAVQIEEVSARTSSGRLLGLTYTDPMRNAGYADSPVGQTTVKFRQARSYICSSAIVGAGMPFAIPFGPVGGGYYIHGLDGREDKGLHLGTPASAGCIRVFDSTACRLYATLKKCGKAKVVVSGEWTGDKVYDSYGHLVAPETPEQAKIRTDAILEQRRAALKKTAD